MKFKYAHLADLHLGSWRDQKMRNLSTQAFLTAMDQCIAQQIDFILFAGDLFNTSLPSLDTLKIVAKKLKELQEKNIPLYVIAGSHDFSPSGKTMIDVLENAGLLTNVCKGTVHPETQQLHLKFTTDRKTGVKITGILGRKGLLDRTYYQNLHLPSLEEEPGYKIFMFHTTLTELKPKHLEMMESHPVSFLPKHFNYYAGGHIHHPTKIEIDRYGPLTYTGALFPNNFAEVEKYSHGGYYIIEDEIKQEDLIQQQNNQHNQIKLHHPQDIENQQVQPLPATPQITWIPLEVIKHQKLILDCSEKSAEVMAFDIINHFNRMDLQNTLVTIRLTGKLKHGRVSDIPFPAIFDQLYRQGALVIMKNTAGLTTEEFSEIKISTSNPELLEEEIIKEHLQQVKVFDQSTELDLTKSLLKAFNTQKREGETITDFQRRVEEDTDKLL